MDAKEFINRLSQIACEEGRPVIATFTVAHCGWMACSGYHPTESIVARPGRRFEHWPSRVGLHSKLSNPPSPVTIGEQEAVQLARELLLKCRRATRHPFLGYRDILNAVYIAFED
jgi:hypothetical protein